MLVTPAIAQDYHIDDTEVSAPFTPIGSNIEGHGQVIFNNYRLHADVQLEHLKPGNVYTAWFAYIDDPTLCGPGGCGDPDFIGDNPVGVFSRMDGVIAGKSGRASFSGEFRDLKLSHKSLVWLMVFDHGPANYRDHRFLARQLLTPQDPILGAPGLGTEHDGEVGFGRGLVNLLIP
jgi:hypothetical protein